MNVIVGWIYAETFNKKLTQVFSQQLLHNILSRLLYIIITLLSWFHFYANCTVCRKMAVVVAVVVVVVVKI